MGHQDIEYEAITGDVLAATPSALNINSGSRTRIRGGRPNWM